jgi:periplasmic protein TonB
MQRARFDPRSWPAHDGGTICLIARPIAGAAIDLAMAERRDIRRRNDRARTLKLPALLSLLGHAAVLLTAILFLPNRTEPPAMPPESSIALMFAPAPAALPSAADVTPAPAEESHETPTTEATPPPVQPEPPATETTATEPPPPTPLPTPPEPEQEAQPVPTEPPPPVQKPSPKRPATARARHAPSPPNASQTPPHTAAQSEQASPAVGSAGPTVTAAIVPPRPVAGMETNRAPIYPEIARRRGEEGRVMLRVDVSADGMPLDVSVAGTSGHPSLDSAALLAVRQWRFIPATQAGRSVAAVADVPIRFHLSD